MKNDKLKIEYLCYLMNRAQIEAEGGRGYLKLCEKLQETMFLPLLEMDENRCSECRNLRYDFAEGYDDNVGDILDQEFGKNGTMMELLVVLAERMSYELADSKYESGTGTWFMEMLTNCGLDYATNATFEDKNMESEVMDILDTVNYRKYGWDGEGSLFPIRWARKDQRYVELIVQMNDYIEENYDIC